jgi:general secretion pathway protein I
VTVKGTRRTANGFTLIEVMVALGIVAIALVAGLKATAALTDNALRQSDMLLAQLCADNALVQVRLAQQMPGVGETASGCQQAGQSFDVAVAVVPTPNPNFRRVDAIVRRGADTLLRVSTVMGRY